MVSVSRNCLGSKIELGAYWLAHGGEHPLLTGDEVAAFGLAVDSMVS